MLKRMSRRQLGALGLGALPGLCRLADARAAAPIRGGTLVIAIDSDPPTVNPDISTSVSDVSVGSLMYDSLVRIDENFDIVPCLAERWSISPDQLTYTFHLVEAQWHDGKPVTSRDVKFTFEAISGRYGAKFTAWRPRSTGSTRRTTEPSWSR